jgi:hypothetical protein
MQRFDIFLRFRLVDEVERRFGRAPEPVEAATCDYLTRASPACAPKARQI